LLLDVKALDSDLASRGRDFTCQTLESGRLAGTVDTKQGEALTVVKAETSLTHSHNRLIEGWLVDFLEVVNADAVKAVFVLRLLTS